MTLLERNSLANLVQDRRTRREVSRSIRQATSIRGLNPFATVARSPRLDLSIMLFDVAMYGLSRASDRVSDPPYRRSLSVESLNPLLNYVRVFKIVNRVSRVVPIIGDLSVLGDDPKLNEEILFLFLVPTRIIKIPESNMSPITYDDENALIGVHHRDRFDVCVNVTEISRESNVSNSLNECVICNVANFFVETRPSNRVASVRASTMSRLPQQIDEIVFGDRLVLCDLDSRIKKV